MKNKEEQTRFIVIYTPNYAIKAFKVVYDSRYPCRFKRHEDAYTYYRNKPAEDESVRIFWLSPDIDNATFLHAYNRGMEICAPGSMYYTDVGIRARRAIEKIDQAIDEFYKGCKESEEDCQCKPRYPIERKED